MAQNASVYHADHACLVCGARRWTRLPDPGAQSIASDWRVVHERLEKYACDACGLGARAAPSHDLYGKGYALYAHAPGGFERARQSLYAAWIAAAVPTPPRRVLDVGCGNGSLLVALRDHWPHAEGLGCDPSADSVAHGAAHGLHLWRGTADDLSPGVDADLVVSINVIEHSADPVRFATRLRAAATEHGAVLVICPDGGRPGVELLFADHLWSFTSGHVATVLSRAGLTVVDTSLAPQALGTFHMLSARADGSAIDVPRVDPDALNVCRSRYLERWRALDEQLQERLPSEVVCFGAGEAAGLLRAYAPRSWQRVRACTADETTSPQFGDLPVVPLDDLGPDTAILVGVRPHVQHGIARRLTKRFANVTTWYDLVGDAW